MDNIFYREENNYDSIRAVPPIPVEYSCTSWPDAKIDAKVAFPKTLPRVLA